MDFFDTIEGVPIRNRFTLRWERSDAKNTSLSLLDAHKSNCGTITVRTQQLGLLFCEWRGDWDWQACPLEFIPALPQGAYHHGSN